MRRAVEEYLRQEVTLKRYLHILRVAETAVMLSERFSLPPLEGWTAGLTHDMAREWPAPRILEAAGADRFGISEQERQVPLLLHGRAAAVELQRHYGERRESVLQAVRWHTTGHPEMGALGMVLYCADYLEPGRSHITRDEYHRLMSYESLEEMTFAILEGQLELMSRIGRTIAPQSYALQESLQATVGSLPCRGEERSGVI